VLVELKEDGMRNSLVRGFVYNEMSVDGIVVDSLSLGRLNMSSDGRKMGLIPLKEIELEIIFC